MEKLIEYFKNKGLRAHQAKVASLVGTAMTNKDIAIQLGVKESTVKHYLTGIYEELDTDRFKIIFEASRFLALEEARSEKT